MIIVGIIFLSRKVFGSNFLSDCFRFISNIEIVVIDNRSNSYFDIYEYDHSFPLPGITLDIANNDLNKSEEYISTSQNKLLYKIHTQVKVQACLNPTGQFSNFTCSMVFYVKFGNKGGALMRRVILLWSISTVLMVGLFLPLWAQEIALTNDSYHHAIPQWYSDGNWIVYEKLDVTGYIQIYKVSSSGGGETSLTSDSYDHRHPQWSQDGKWIVYYKYDATGFSQIYKVSSGVGVEEEEIAIRQDATGISVYPNPFTSVVSINFSDKFPVSGEGTNLQLGIYDLSGKIVRSIPITNNHYLLTTDFAPGIYFFNVEGFKPLKVIKMRE